MYRIAQTWYSIDFTVHSVIFLTKNQQLPPHKKITLLFCLLYAVTGDLNRHINVCKDLTFIRVHRHTCEHTAVHVVIMTKLITLYSTCSAKHYISIVGDSDFNIVIVILVKFSINF
jgi:hypothetical protein